MFCQIAQGTNAGTTRSFILDDIYALTWPVIGFRFYTRTANIFINKKEGGILGYASGENDKQSNGGATVMGESGFTRQVHYGSFDSRADTFPDNMDFGSFLMYAESLTDLQISIKTDNINGIFYAVTTAPIIDALTVLRGGRAFNQDQVFGQGTVGVVMDVQGINFLDANFPVIATTMTFEVDTARDMASAQILQGVTITTSAPGAARIDVRGISFIRPILDVAASGTIRFSGEQ